MPWPLASQWRSPPHARIFSTSTTGLRATRPANGFHEAGHIVLHGKKTIFIDEQGGDNSEVEHEANKFASEWLIPATAFGQFKAADDFSSAAVKRFAAKLGISPGIVVGRLHHEGLIHYAHHNGLREPLDWE